MLSVAVHYDNEIAARALEAGAESEFLSKVSAQAQAAQGRQRLRLVRDDLPRFIG
jgi:hypothetical protein